MDWNNSLNAHDPNARVEQSCPGDELTGTGYDSPDQQPDHDRWADDGGRVPE